jgi:3-methylcrotonyl-CoA carboxylase alpha subunit/acetyl-CoA/propionyl-CoA carboxylase biotin carboxyl carrier protein
MFTTVLVANRGEIARRVIDAARKQGLRTVAVYSDADRDAQHVQEADVAVRIGPQPAGQSYLSIPAVMDAVERSGADAVHPGYGFLAENAEFARACEESGLVFIGPPAVVIERLGRKDEARRLAVNAQVPVLPALEDMGDEQLIARADVAVGYPLIVKAAAGGGGKAMHLVREHNQLPAALVTARREARSAFGDGTLLLEHFVEHGRHIEVQVLGDAHGNVVHLLERDCSVQRRHQKVVEEAPAPTISLELRDALTASAVRLAKSIGYVNAGTVEFLVQAEDAYFLEMNTRLQVEHAVTEYVLGIDLIELQLRVAGGERLPWQRTEIASRGHAIEARVYAEDAEHDFLPQAGTATTVRWSSKARVDAALESGQVVTTWYDPMLAKVIAHGATREAARRSLIAALDDSAVLGLTTNLGFLRRLLASDEFRDAAIDTAWLDRHSTAFRARTACLARCAAAWAYAERLPQVGTDPFGAGDGWRAGSPPALIEVEFTCEGAPRRLQVNRGGREVLDRGRSWHVEPLPAPPGLVRLEIDGEVHSFHVESSPKEITIAHQGESFTFGAGPQAPEAASAEASDGIVFAPMPGTVLVVRAQPERQVRAGDSLVVMEAMKMELALTAPFDGVVESVNVSPNDRVALGHPMFEVRRVAT